jgi:hypothetical protein
MTRLEEPVPAMTAPPSDEALPDLLRDMDCQAINNEFKLAWQRARISFANAAAMRHPLANSGQMSGFLAPVPASLRSPPRRAIEVMVQKATVLQADIPACPRFRLKNQSGVPK